MRTMMASMEQDIRQFKKRVAVVRLPAARQCVVPRIIILSILSVLWRPGAGWSTDFDKQLLQAVRNEDLNAIKAAVDNGANINATVHGVSALLAAATIRNPEIIIFLLTKGADPNACNESSKTALILAAANWFTENAKLLLVSGADVNAQDEVPGCTPLMYAAKSGYVETVKMLVDAGSDVNCRSLFSGATALMMAAHTGDVQSVMILLKAGADMNVRDYYGCLAVDYARANDTQTARLLSNMQPGAHIRKSPLHDLAADRFSPLKLLRMFWQMNTCCRQIEFCPE